MLETISHQDEFTAWGENGESDWCKICRYYHETTDYCLLNQFQGEEKEGERWPTEDCLHYEPGEPLTSLDDVNFSIFSQ